MWIFFLKIKGLRLLKRIEKPAEGFKPPTYCLQGSCSITELRRHNNMLYSFFKNFFYVRNWSDLIENLIGYVHHQNEDNHVIRRRKTKEQAHFLHLLYLLKHE